MHNIMRHMLLKIKVIERYTNEHLYHMIVSQSDILQSTSSSTSQRRLKQRTKSSQLQRGRKLQGLICVLKKPAEK